MTQPTCGDNVQNGNEDDVDCGGSCGACTGDRLSVGCDGTCVESAVGEMLFDDITGMCGHFSEQCDNVT